MPLILHDHVRAKETLPYGNADRVCNIHSYTSSNDARMTTLVSFGITAIGTHCSTNFFPNRIRADHEGHCDPDGALVCSDDGKTYMRCVHGGWIEFSGLAAGTICVDGRIVLET